jgi:putative tricarboxylic transport membrane protein
MLPSLLLLAVALMIAGGYLYMTLALPYPALSDPLGPQIFPLLVCAGLFLCAVLMAVEAWRANAAAATRTPSTGDTGARFDTGALLVVGGICVWTALYFVAFERAGFVISTVVFLFGLMAVFNPGRTGVNACCAAGFALGAWLLFVKLLSVRLPSGILPF